MYTLCVPLVCIHISNDTIPALCLATDYRTHHLHMTQNHQGSSSIFTPAFQALQAR